MIKLLSRMSRITVFLLVVSGTAGAVDVAIPGMMAGKSAVSPTGAMQYELPLTLPPSVGGFGPALSIKYNSGTQDSTGLMGIGWGLNGLEYISRCPQTLAQDNQIKGVSFTGTDRFCLNGQRLIAVSGGYGMADTEYRTETDNFTKIVSYGAQGNGPSYFKAWTKDGLVKEFGNTSDSKLFVNVGSQAQTDTTTFTSTAPLGTTVQAWGLNKVTNRSANYWAVAYDTGYANAGVLYPLTLSYAGHAGVTPNNRVDIGYEDRTMFDKGYQYQAGSLVSQSRRIKTIKTFAGTAQAGEYRFVYQEVGTATAQANHSRLSTMEECHFDSQATVYCLAKTSVTWSSGETHTGLPGLSTYVGQAPFPLLSPQTNVPVSLAGIAGSNYISLAADITGDGRSDVALLGFQNGTLQVRTLLAQAGVTNTSFIAGPGPAITNASFPTGITPKYALSDVNRDGKADLILAFMGSTYKIFTYSATGDGNFSSSPTIDTYTPASTMASGYRFMVTDANGDGIADFVAIRGNPSCDGLFTCGGVVRSASGDVRVILRNADGTAGAMQTSTLNLSAWANSNIQDMTIADIDGDGFPDAVLSDQVASPSQLVYCFQNYGCYFGHPATGDYGVYVAKGNGTGGFSGTTATLAMPVASLNATPNLCESTPADVGNYWANLVDTNRDGLVDVLLDQSAGCYTDTSHTEMRWIQSISTAIARGDGSFAIKGGHSQFAHEKAVPASITGWVPIYLDFDGNGTLDVMRTRMDTASGNVWALLTVGMGTGDFSAATTNFQVSTAPSTWTNGGFSGPAMSADTNADGMPDLLMPMVNDGGSSQSYINALVLHAMSDVDPNSINLQNQVTQLQRGQLADEFSYAALPSNMTDSDPLYVMSHDAAHPQVDLNMPVIAVSQARSKLNGVLQRTTDYRYEGAKADLKGRGFLGFRKSKSTTTRVVTLPGGSTQTLVEETETTFRQDFPYTGLPELVAQKANGVLVSRSESNVSTDFTVTNPYPGVYFPRAIKTLQSVFDPASGTLLSTTEQVLGHDAYGNVLNETATTRNAGQTESFVTTSVNTYFPADVNAWKVDLLQTQQVTAQRSNRTDIVRQSSRDYDADGVLKQEIAEPNTPALRVQTDYLRDVYGNVTFVTTSGAGDAAYPDTAIQSRTTEMRYEAGTAYPAGVFKTKDINPLTHSVSRTFDPLTGAVLTEMSANSLTTTLVQDALGRETSRTNPDGTQATTVRETCSTFVSVGSGTTDCETGDYLKVTVAQTGSAPAYVFFDGAGREVRKASRAFDGTNYIISRTEYDEAGRVKRTSKPAFNTVAYSAQQWTSSEYDSVGRPTKQTLPGARVTTTVYNGLVTTTTNPKNQTRIETRNAVGEIVQIQDANSQLLTYELDALGRITKTTDAKNNQISFTLDKVGRKTQQQDPDLGTWNYRYNVLGALVWQQDAKNQVTTFTYDMLGRPLTRAEPDLNSTWAWDTTTEGFGKLGKLSSDNGFERNYSYDGFGRPVQTSTKKTIDPNAQASDLDFAYGTSYDSAGRPETLTYPTGFGYKNVYDSNGYLKEVVDASTGTLYWRANTRDAEGHITRETLGNNLVTDRTYKPDSSYLDTLQTGTLSGSTLTASVQNDVYSFDAIGSLTTRSQYFGSVSINETFGYDSLNRLSTATLLNGTPKTASYDEIGNIKTRSDVGLYNYIPTANCTGIHKVCSISGALNTNFSYDANGNVQSGNGRTVTWTSFNMPVQITQGTTTESFLYTADHERARRTSVENGQTTTTVYLNPRIDLGGTFEKSYKPDGSVEYVHHVYAGGQVVGSVVTTAALNAPPLWSTTLSTAPTTSDPNPTGLTMPTAAQDPYNLIRWDSSSGSRLTFLSSQTAEASNPHIVGQRTYLNQNVVFRGEIRIDTIPTPNARSFRFGVYNNGSSAAASKTARIHGLHLSGTKAYAYVMDGNAVDASGNLIPVMVDLNYPIGVYSVPYVAEIETTPTSSVLYLYRSGQTREQGVRHELSMDWRGPSSTLVRNMRASTYSGPLEVHLHTTYLDNLSESSFTAIEPRYFHKDHLGSVIAVTNQQGQVLERMSYDAWGKRRNPEGSDDVLVTPLWSTDLSTAPTTVNPNSTGLTMPTATADPNGLITWDNSTGDGRLVFTTKTTTAASYPGVYGQRTYLNQNVILRGEITPTASVGNNGRFIQFGLYNNGSTAAASKTYRRHVIYLRYNKAYANFVDGTSIDPVTGNLRQVNKDLGYAIVAGTTYVAEIETTPTSSVLYLYKKGESRAQGVRHELTMDWRSASGTLVRRLMVIAYGNTAESTNITYLDNLSETTWALQNTLKGQSTKHGFTEHEHLDSIGLVHMNGRLYDPLLGRFMSADPNIFYPDNLQDFNRYSYVHNNPLSFTDPSGFSATNGINLDFSNFNLDTALSQSNLSNLSSQFNLSFNAPTGQFNLFGANFDVKGPSQQTSLLSKDWESMSNFLLPYTTQLGKRGEPGTRGDFASGYFKANANGAKGMLSGVPVLGLLSYLPNFNVSNNELLGSSTFEMVSWVGGLFTGSVGRFGLGLQESVVAKGGGLFEVLTEAAISGSSRSAHRASANSSLAAQLRSDADFAAGMNKQLGTDVLKHMESGKSGLRNPPDTEWHHPKGSSDSMWLLRRETHRDPALQDYLHQGGTGGFRDYYGQ